MIEVLGNNAHPLEDARGCYIDELDRFRHQLQVRRGGMGDFERLGESSSLYAGLFQARLLDGSEAPLGEFTVQEVEARRGQIAKRFAETPLRLHADTEVLIGATAVMSAALNIQAGRIPSTIGSGLLAATSYFGFKYRRTHPLISSSVNDSELLQHGLESLKVSGDAASEQCMLIFDATLQSEEAAVTRMAMQLVAARTYTPLGFMRLAVYNFHDRRRRAKAALNTENY